MDAALPENALTDTLFFYASKLFWTFASPDHLLLLLLSFAVLRLWFVRSPAVPDELGRGPSIAKQVLPRKLLTFTLLGFWLIAIYPWSNWLLHPLESRYQKPELATLMPADSSTSVTSLPVAGIIVLGGAERLHASHYWQSLEVNAVAERLLTMIELLQRYPQLPVIYTSGSGMATQQDMRGADIVQAYMQDAGFAERVIFERQSRNTYENALYSRPIMIDLTAARPEDQGKPWLLVTSAFHMPRAVAIFQHLQLPVLPYPVDHWSLSPASQSLYFNFSDNLRTLKMGVREWIGLLAYRLTGKTDSLLGEPVPALTDPASSL